jgi:hypothetical protein
MSFIDVNNFLFTLKSNQRETNTKKEIWMISMVGKIQTRFGGEKS